MPTTIAKISVPRLFGVVPRARLFERLDENRGRPLIWIEGPPGAGKTTLVASYLEARKIPVVWYQVDSGDVDPAGVFLYLALAAANFDSSDVALPRLAPEHLVDLPAFARIYFRALFAVLPSAVVLVFDGYQEVPTDAPLQVVVRAAVAELPRDSSIVCVSRIGAPPPFSQLVATSAMVSLRWDSLRLTLEETQAIAGAKGVCDDRIVRALHDRSEGWAAGITLMLERLGDSESESGELPTDSRESVFNYFAALLLAQASEQARRVLLSVACLPQIPVSVAIALSPNDEAPQVLEYLFRRQLFVDKRAGREPTYQFHALLREFLVARLAQEYTADDLVALQRRAASAMDDAGYIDVSFDLRVQSADWDGAIALICREATNLLNTGRWQTLSSWIEELPPAVQTGNPILLYWLGLSRSSVDPAAAIATLRDALPAFRASGERRGRILCLAALLNASYPLYAGLGLSTDWLGELVGELDDMHEVLTPREQLQVWSGLSPQLLFVWPWHEKVVDLPNRIFGLMAEVDDPRVRITAATGALGAVFAMGLAFDIGEAIIAVYGDLADRADISPGDAAWFLYAMGHHRFLQARYEEAWRDVSRACDVAERFGLRERFPELLLLRFMVEFRYPGWTVAEATWKEVKALPMFRRPMTRALAAIYEARLCQHHRRFQEAADLARASLDAVNQAGTPFQKAVFGMLAAECIIAGGGCHEVDLALTDAKATIEASPAMDGWRSALGLAEAYQLFAMGVRDQAVDRLKLVLGTARTGCRKYYLRYLECAMPPMFSLALEEGIEVDLVLELIRLFRLRPPGEAPDQWPRPVRIRSLGRFEVLINDESLTFARKLPKKTLALLKVLVAHGGRDVTEDYLCDALWGDDEADAARQALSITILRLRKLLGRAEVVLNQGGKVWLDGQLCWVDAWRFEDLLTGGSGSEQVGRALRLYDGAFLPEDDGESWSVAARERLRGKFIHALATNGKALEAAGDEENAIHLYQRGLDADPIVEVFHQGLMRCYRSLGRDTEAIGVYRRARQTLSVVLGVAPSAESERLYRKILAAMPDAVRTEDAAIVPLAFRSRSGLSRRPRR